MVSQMKVASYAIVTQVVQMDFNAMQTVNVHAMTMSKADDVTDVKRTNIIVIWAVWIVQIVIIWYVMQLMITVKNLPK